MCLENSLEVENLMVMLLMQGYSSLKAEVKNVDQADRFRGHLCGSRQVLSVLSFLKMWTSAALQAVVMTITK
jgi:hypothetical protein